MINKLVLTTFDPNIEFKLKHNKNRPAKTKIIYLERIVPLSIPAA
jgi:hypothetical protein